MFFRAGEVASPGKDLSDLQVLHCCTGRVVVLVVQFEGSVETLEGVVVVCSVEVEIAYSAMSRIEKSMIDGTVPGMQVQANSAGAVYQLHLKSVMSGAEDLMKNGFEIPQLFQESFLND